MAELVQSAPIVWSGGFPFSGYLVAELFPPTEQGVVSVSGAVVPRFTPLRIENGWLKNRKLHGTDEFDVPGCTYILHLYDANLNRRAQYPEAGGIEVKGESTPLPTLPTPDPHIILPAIMPDERSPL